MSSAPESIAFLTVDLARLFRQAFERAIAAEGLDLTAGEARTLYHVAGGGGVRQTALAERMHVEPMTLSNFLDRLETRGLIAREPDPGDRRAKRVVLTKTAQPLVQRIDALSAGIRRRATAGLSVAEVETLRRAFQLMRGNLLEEEVAAA